MKNMISFIFPALFVGIIFVTCSRENASQEEKESKMLNELIVVGDSSNEIILIDKLNNLTISKSYFSGKEGFKILADIDEYSLFAQKLHDQMHGSFNKREVNMSIDQGWFDYKKLSVEILDYSVKIKKQLAPKGIYDKANGFKYYKFFIGKDTVDPTVLFPHDIKTDWTDVRKSYTVKATLDYVYKISVSESSGNIEKSDTIHFQFPTSLILATTNFKK
jgi:hypothetical protein